MRLSVMLVAAALPLAACAVDDAARREVVSLRSQVDQMRAQRSRDQKVRRELENRLFLLEDKLETAQVQQGRNPDLVPRLPVVKRRPPPAPEPAPEPDSTPSTPALDEEGVEIVYEGEAADPTGAPPLIRIEDDPPPRERRERRAASSASAPAPANKSYPDPAEVIDRIPVVPLPGAKGKAKPAADTPGEDPVLVYKTAYAALVRHAHAEAIGGFQRFLDQWPRHDYADNAQYWLAEAYYDLKDFRAALQEFRAVVARYPSGNKAPDALLKVGYCYANLGETTPARDVLGQVVQIYPKSDAAALAAKRLEELRP